MDNIFTKFYSKYISKIHDFLNSSLDVLYIDGFSGCGKSSVLKQSLKLYNKNILIFPHLCFAGNSIDDFLLSFYDAFRDNAIKGKITLVKNPEEGFLQKVGFYFKNLAYPSVIVIDNYEIVSKDSAIEDFLSYVASFKNVKLILISKEENCPIIENPTIGVGRLTFEIINFDEFKRVFKSSFEVEDEIIEKFYNLTKGYELYIKMTLNYLSACHLTLGELIEEFENKERDYPEFIISKQISLIPNYYYDILKNFAAIEHNVSLKLFENYKIGDEKQLPYLISNFAVSEFFETYYIKSYLKKYFTDILSLQDKVALYSKIISIYENELSKSLKDRLLRLSREYIRNRITSLKETLPKVERVKSSPSFNYAVQAITSNPKWFVTEPKKKTGRLDELRKKRNERLLLQNEDKKDEAESQTKTELQMIFEEVEAFMEQHKYEDAISSLKRAQSFENSFDDKVKIYSKIAQNYIKMNNYNEAVSSLNKLCDICTQENSIELYLKYKIQLGKIYRRIYNFSKAKECFCEVIKKNISDGLTSSAKFFLAEIYDLEENFDSALLEYKGAFELILKTKGEKEYVLPEIAFKIASIYDENGEYEKAYIEYQNSVKYAETSGNNKFLIKAYANSGTILSYLGNTQDALSCYKYAYEVAKEFGSDLDKYYIVRDIASVYLSIGSEEAYNYLTLALEYAKNSGNSFETAISLIELGDYYYNLKQNEQALICYFQAKSFLGEDSKKENLEKINLRIEDMKIKLGNFIFAGMKELYDTN